MDCVEEDTDSIILKMGLKRIYSKYCKKHKIKMKGDKTIKWNLEELYGAGEEQKRDEGINTYNWVGIRFKENVLGEDILANS